MAQITNQHPTFPKRTKRDGGAIIRRVKHESAGKIGFRTQEGISIVKYSDIRYCRAMGNYCQVFLTNDTRIVLSKTLKVVASFLPKSEFLRTHQSFLVRIDQVVHVNGVLELTDGTTIPISRNQRNYVCSFFKNHFEIV